jgi:hypothetical protein
MATWKPYHKFLEKQWNGNAVDLDGTGLKIMLTTVTYVPTQATDEFKSSVTNEVTGTNYTARGEALGTPTVNLATGTVTFDAADVQWLQNAAGFSNARVAVLYHDTAVDATSKLVAYGVFAADKGNVDGDFTLEMDALGILTSIEGP